MAKSGKPPKRTEKKSVAPKSPTSAVPAAQKAPGKLSGKSAGKEAERPVAKAIGKPVAKAPGKSVGTPVPKAKAAAAKSPFGKPDLDHFRSLLLARRDRILRQVTAMEREALKASDQDFSVDHMADHGSDNYDQDFTLSLVESERRELYEINGALGRIRDGTYGICEGTGEVISRPRLEAIPYTRYSIEYQRKVEAGEIDEDEIRVEEPRERNEEEE